MTSAEFQRLIANKKLFNLDEGKLKIMGMYGRINKTLTTIIAHKILQKNIGVKKTSDILYALGENQSYNAVKMMINKRGMKQKENEYSITKEILGQSEFLGFGKAEIFRLDTKNKQAVIIENNSTYLEISNKIEGQKKRTIDHFARGLVGGIFKFLFDEEVLVKAERLREPTKVKYSIKTKKEIEKINPIPEEWKELIPNDDLDLSDLESCTLKNLLN